MTPQRRQDDTLIEEWRPVIGYEGHYEVSNRGRVRSLDRYCRRGNHMTFVRGRFLRTYLDKSGHPKVGLSLDRRARTDYVHRLVALAFLGEPEDPTFEVCHNDGNGGNNLVTNLRWDTHESNMNDTRQERCLRGHTYAPEHTYIRPNGRRTCRLCVAHLRQARREAGAR